MALLNKKEKVFNIILIIVISYKSEMFTICRRIEKREIKNPNEFNENEEIYYNGTTKESPM